MSTEDSATLFDLLRTAASYVALVFSAGSLYFARKSWMKSNRPIVTAYLNEASKGNVSTPFNLVVVNSGTRPAINVRLKCEPDELIKIVDDRDEQALASFVSNFTKEARLSVLKNGEEIDTWFGMITRGGDRTNLRHGSSAKITVAYSDLDGNHYSHIVELYVWARRGFGGGTWNVRE